MSETDITIPPEARDALRSFIAKQHDYWLSDEDARAACLAMIRVWPNMFVYQYGDDGSHSVILPLPKEGA